MAENLAYIGCFVEREAHRMLIRMATLRGKKPDVMAQELFMKGLEKEVEQMYAMELDDCPPDFQLFATYTAVRGNEERRRQLVTIAITVQETSDTVMADRLQELCTGNGFQVDDIMAQAAALLAIAPDASVIFSEQDAVGQAAVFLAELFRKRNTNAVKQTDIEAEAARQGISMGAVKLAKSRLGMRSRRSGRSWVWEIAVMTAPSSVRVKT